MFYPKHRLRGWDRGPRCGRHPALGVVSPHPGVTVLLDCLARHDVWDGGRPELTLSLWAIDG